MRNESSLFKLDQVARGRNLIIVAVADAVLFLIANIAYGAGKSTRASQQRVQCDVGPVPGRVLSAGRVRDRLPGSGHTAARQGPGLTSGCSHRARSTRVLAFSMCPFPTPATARRNSASRRPA